MGFTLKHREQDSRGSFVAWGIGFEYKYCAESSILNIINAIKRKPLINISFDELMAENALAYTGALEKATQINALTFSNGQHVDLSETLKERHLKIMLETSAMQARYSLDLEAERFERFERRFCRDYTLSRLRFNKCVNSIEETSFYRAELETSNYNSINCSGAHLYGVINKLSAKAMRDLMAREYGYREQSAAQNLLSASSNLGIISQILNKNFNPIYKIRQKSSIRAYISERQAMQ